MGDVGDEARTDELDGPNFETMERLRQNYMVTMHTKRAPPEGMEPTAEQMTYIMALLKEQSVPYANFAMWGPHGDRTMRKLMGTARP